MVEHAVVMDVGTLLCRPRQPLSLPTWCWIFSILHGSLQGISKTPTEGVLDLPVLSKQHPTFNYTQQTQPDVMEAQALVRLNKDSRKHSSTSTLKLFNVMASTFQLPDHDIPVTLPQGLSKEQLLGFHPFKNWVATLTSSLALQSTAANHPFGQDPYRLRSVTVQAFDLFDASRVGFLKLAADVSNGAGESLPGAVFLRGPSVAMMVVLMPDDGADERHVLLTVQPRVAAGSLAFVELPAGMVDDEGQFAGTAAREIKEELGLDIPASELTCLSDLAAEEAAAAAGGQRDAGEKLARAVYPSAGGCDEYIPIFMHERRVPRKQLAEWTGKLTGLRDEGEKITLKLVPMDDLWYEGACDAKCLAAIALWQGLRRKGRL
ncbi:hypothetical protein RB596_009931 [Gaeumannomyces avenae]